MAYFQLYRVNPVYGFVEPGGTLRVDVLREAGVSKTDKLVFALTKAGADELNPKTPFGSSDSNCPKIAMPLIA